jgi:hypothetical protein
MFCKFCANIPTTDFNNHNLFDKNGKTICPRLLSNKCKVCNKLGHTESHCQLKYNIFSYLEDEEQYHSKDMNIDMDKDYFNLTTNPIIWGKGTTLLQGQNWADILGY